MIKEIESIITLQERRNRMSSIIEVGNSVIGQKTAAQNSLREEVGTSFDADIDYVNALKSTKRVTNSVDRKNKALEDFDKEIEPEVRNTATVYLNRLSSLQEILPRLNELMGRGFLSEEDVQPHRIELEELLRLQQPNTLLQRGIDRIRKEEVEKKKINVDEETRFIVVDLVKVELKETQFGRFRYSLENRALGPQSAKLLTSLSGTSITNFKTREQLVPEVYPGEPSFERGIDKLNHLINDTTKTSLEGTTLEIDRVQIPIEGKPGKKYGYFLRRKLPSQADIQRPADESYAFEDGEVIKGETGKLLNRLSPFSSSHIVSSQELLQELAEESSSQTLQEVSATLLSKGLRLAYIPSQKNPTEVAGYYVGTYMPNVRIALLGDIVRYEDEKRKSQIRLKEDEWSLLHALYKGEARQVKDLPKSFNSGNPDNQRNFINSLNKQLAQLTGREDTIVSLGDENFGQWYKIKNASITFMDRYLPVYPSRQEALHLIFENRPGLTRADIISALGQTSGNKRPARALSVPQARVALSKALARLENRVSANLATEDEIKLHQEMVEYMAKQYLLDRKSLMLHIVNKLTNPTGESVTSPSSVIIFETPTKKFNKRERKEQEIGEELGKYLELVIEEIGDNSLNVREAREKFTLLSGVTIVKASQGHWISSKAVQGQTVYFAPDLATMMYIEKNDVQDPRSRKQVYKLALQEYEKIQNRENGK